jgi:hypothetical protein
MRLCVFAKTWRLRVKRLLNGAPNVQSAPKGLLRVTQEKLKRYQKLVNIKIKMSSIPIRTTVIGSYPFPGWLEFASHNLDKFGAADIEEMIEDAVIAAIHDQVTAVLM